MSLSEQHLFPGTEKQLLPKSELFCCVNFSLCVCSDFRVSYCLQFMHSCTSTLNIYVQALAKPELQQQTQFVKLVILEGW